MYMYMYTPSLLGLGSPGCLVQGSPGMRSSQGGTCTNLLLRSFDEKHKHPKNHMLACLLACLPACSPACLLVCLPAACFPALHACKYVCIDGCLSACLPACLPACLTLPALHVRSHAMMGGIELYRTDPVERNGTGIK